MPSDEVLPERDVFVPREILPVLSELSERLKYTNQQAAALAIFSLTTILRELDAGSLIIVVQGRDLRLAGTTSNGTSHVMRLEGHVKDVRPLRVIKE
jgi:hypothetical protein